MEIINLYRYKREEGKYTISPNKPNTEYTELYRIVADENKKITRNGEDFYSTIDTNELEGWYETEEELSETELKAQAYDILIGEVE